MKTLVGVVLASGLSSAAAGALQECKSDPGGEVRVLPCLERAKEVATEQLLERYSSKFSRRSRHGMAVVRSRRPWR
jgi:hypothetical protein